ncbi:MAG: SRPBCC domain-containing protein [Bacteroidota bacterium]
MESKSVENKSYKESIAITASPEAVFKALSLHIDEWWGGVDKLINQEGDVFRVSWGEPWYQFKVLEYRPNHKLTWECTDANQIINGLQGVQKEWVGTKLHWEIERKENEVILSFEHLGLTPQMICYDTCSSVWSDFISRSLKHYLEGE